MAYSWPKCTENPEGSFHVYAKEVKYFQKYAERRIKFSKEKSNKDKVDDLLDAKTALSLAISYNNDAYEMYHASMKKKKEIMLKGMELMSLFEELTMTLAEEKKEPEKKKAMASRLHLWTAPEKPPTGLAAEGMKRFGHCVYKPPDEASDDRWNEIVGNEEAKRYIYDQLLYPILYEGRYPSKLKGTGILLFGPSGTGKTMIGKAIATKLRICYVHVQPSELINKYVGESEKLVRIFFAMVEYLLPCVLFMDEIDSLLGQRDSGSSQETKRGVSNQLLQAMEGKEGLFIIGTTNMPWQIDAAFLRRLGHRCYIQLPTEEQRYQIIKNYMKDIPNSLLRHDLEMLAKKTDGLSGSDICFFLQNASRRAYKKGTCARYYARDNTGFWHPCSPKHPFAKRITTVELREQNEPFASALVSRMDLELTGMKCASENMALLPKYKQFAKMS